MGATVEAYFSRVDTNRLLQKGSGQLQKGDCILQTIADQKDRHRSPYQKTREQMIDVALFYVRFTMERGDYGTDC
jgi:hypothetical protein